MQERGTCPESSAFGERSYRGFPTQTALTPLSLNWPLRINIAGGHPIYRNNLLSSPDVQIKGMTTARVRARVRHLNLESTGSPNAKFPCFGSNWRPNSMVPTLAFQQTMPVDDGLLTACRLSTRIKGVGNIETKRSLKTTRCTSSGKSPGTSPAPVRRAGIAELLWPRLARCRRNFRLSIRNNKAYLYGQAGSIYKQAIPLANPSRKPGSGKPTTWCGRHQRSTLTAL
jgi:hypothetical protein